ncbi:MAG TPA: hypothetical protein VE080_00425 [Candidatus Aquicultoraceae bacterium]|nr:hypothetical protein [Candidatus Aquicultoraceae bacterium]
MQRRGFHWKYVYLAAVAWLAALVLAQCAAVPQRWPEYERRADARLVLIQERIGEGLKTGALTTDESQAHLARLEDARREYGALRDRPATREEWETFLRRLDALEADVDRDLRRPPPPRLDLPRIEERILSLQRRIDDGRTTGRLTPVEARDFQARLDAIRADYLRMREGRPYTYETRTDLLRRLDLLEADLARYP